jgi:hypothetical protein
MLRPNRPPHPGQSDIDSFGGSKRVIHRWESLTGLNDPAFVV